MTFVFAFALAAVVLVAAPYFAHRLRRKRADTLPFAPAHLVPAAPPRARRRAKLEDRALFGTRALAVVALALLGASPFVHCSRLSLSRSSGASVALAVVLDDSMSMRAKLGKRTRWELAKDGAAELLASTREGDAVAIVLAGASPRVALAPTTDLRGARAALDALVPSDRATDLDGALAMAQSLLDGLPQVDRRVVLLSDLADGIPGAPPLGQGGAVPVWNALPAIRGEGHDCAVLHADRSGQRVHVRVGCSPGFDPSKGAPRTVTLTLGGETLVRSPSRLMEPGDVILSLPHDLPAKADEPGALVAHLLGNDVVAEDDAAPVLREAGPGSVAVVVPSDSEIAATGGAPVVEQALAALSSGIVVRPLPQIPDRLGDLTPFVGVILDDPPGLTPEERRALGEFVDGGGVLLVALGPRSASPPLGASFEPFVKSPVAWSETSARGVDPASAVGALAESAASLSDLAVRDRAELRREDVAGYEPLLLWKDRAPFLLRRRQGRGEVWLVTLPFALDASELPLRPAFLALLSSWIDAARARTVPRRTEVGATWTFPDAHKVDVVGPGGEAIPVVTEGAVIRAIPPRLGLYRIDVDGRAEARVAEPAPRELDQRPRTLSPQVAARAFGENRAAIDASPGIAVALLFLVALELGLRVRAGRKAEPAA